MKKWILCSFSLLFMAYSIAQNLPAFRVGQAFNSTSKNQFQGFIGETDSLVFGVESLFALKKLKNLFVTRFNKNTLQPILTKPIIPSETAEFTFEPIEIFMLKDSIYLISRAKSKLTTTRWITLNAISKTGELQKTMFLDSIYRLETDDQEDFSVVVDEAEKRFLILNYLPYELHESQKIAVSAYNIDGSIYWKSTIDFPYLDKTFSLEESYYDGEKTLVFLTKNTTGMTNEKSTHSLRENNKYHLFGFQQTDAHLKEIELQLKDKWIRNCTVHWENNQIVLGGYFSNTNAFDVDGVFAILLDQNFAIQSASIDVFSADELRSLQILNSKSKEIAPLKDYNLNQIVMLDSGQFAVIGEQFYKQMHANYDSRVGVTNYSDVFNYNTILVSIYDAKGQLIKHVGIPKMQSTVNDDGYFSSYFVGKNAHEFCFYFNDTYKNHGLLGDDLSKIKTMTNYRKTEVVMLKINNLGEFTRSYLTQASDKMMLIPSLSEQLRDKTTYLFNNQGSSENIIAIDCGE